MLDFSSICWIWVQQQQDNASQTTPFSSLCHPAEAMQHTGHIKDNIKIWLNWLDTTLRTSKYSIALIPRYGSIKFILKVVHLYSRLTLHLTSGRTTYLWSPLQKWALSVGTAQTSRCVIKWKGVLGSSLPRPHPSVNLQIVSEKSTLWISSLGCTERN